MAINKEDKPMTQADFKKIIEAYKEQNPEKYKVKKDELDAKLKALAPAKKK